MLGSFKEQQGGQCGCSTVSEEMEEDEINKVSNWVDNDKVKKREMINYKFWRPVCFHL